MRATLRTPTLVIQGQADPFIPIEHGMRSAQSIAGARTLWVERMGHDIPDPLVDTLVAAMRANFEREHVASASSPPPDARAMAQ